MRSGSRALAGGDAGAAAQALRFFERARAHPDYDTLALLERMAQCHAQLGQRADALGLYQAVLDGAPSP